MVFKIEWQRQKKAEELLKNSIEREDTNLSEDGRIRLKSTFKESLPFD